MALAPLSHERNRSRLVCVVQTGGFFVARGRNIWGQILTVKRYSYNELLNLVNYSRKYIPAQTSMFIQVHKSIMTNDNEAVINILKTYSVCESYIAIGFQLG